MTSEEFIAAIRLVVYESSVRGTLSLMQNPPGRRPPQHVVALAQWFSHLSETERKHVEAAVAHAARQAVFGMLSVLDGSRQIESTTEKGVLELHFKTTNHNVLLNVPDGESLHDLFNQQVPVQPKLIGGALSR